jgi:hypothetical protein
MKILGTVKRWNEKKEGGKREKRSKGKYSGREVGT